MLISALPGDCPAPGVCHHHLRPLSAGGAVGTRAAPGCVQALRAWSGPWGLRLLCARPEAPPSSRCPSLIAPCRPHPVFRVVFFISTSLGCLVFLPLHSAGRRCLEQPGLALRLELPLSGRRGDRCPPLAPQLARGEGGRLRYSPRHIALALPLRPSVTCPGPARTFRAQWRRPPEHPA